MNEWRKEWERCWRGEGFIVSKCRIEVEKSSVARTWPWTQVWVDRWWRHWKDVTWSITMSFRRPLKDVQFRDREMWRRGAVVMMMMMMMMMMVNGSSDNYDDVQSISNCEVGVTNVAVFGEHDIGWSQGNGLVVAWLAMVTSFFIIIRSKVRANYDRVDSDRQHNYSIIFNQNRLTDYIKKIQPLENCISTWKKSNWMRRPRSCSSDNSNNSRKTKSDTSLVVDIDNYSVIVNGTQDDDDDGDGDDDGDDDDDDCFFYWWSYFQPDARHYSFSIISSK